jgi:hypothetical protein
MAEKMQDGYYEVYWPRAPRKVEKKKLAPRLHTLNGKTVAQLWDFLFRGDEVFQTLEVALKQKFPDIRFVSWKEFGNTHGKNEREILAALPERFKALGIDAVISGMGC